MNISSGIDLIEISRIEKALERHGDRFLERIFSVTELERLRSYQARKANPHLIAAEIAARFAAKEAFFKALCSALVTMDITEHKFSLLTIAPLACVTETTWGVPKLSVDWKTFEKKTLISVPPLTINLSLSHETSHAVAFVVISKK